MHGLCELQGGLGLLESSGKKRVRKFRFLCAVLRSLGFNRKDSRSHWRVFSRAVSVSRHCILDKTHPGRCRTSLSNLWLVRDETEKPVFQKPGEEQLSKRRQYLTMTQATERPDITRTEYLPLDFNRSC